MLWSAEYFGNKVVQVAEKISQYSNTSQYEVRSLIEETGNSEWKKVSERLEGYITYDAFTKMLQGIREPLLQYLPGTLQFGKLRVENTMDERSTLNKEGPVSGLMNHIEDMY